MKEILQRRGWVLWILWVLASTASWAVGLILFRALFGTDSAVSQLLGLLLFGGLVGLAQWFILWQHIPRSGWWVLASTAGVAAGVTACIVLLYLVSFAVEILDPAAWVIELPSSIHILIGGALLGAVFGSIVGMAQSMALPWHVLDTGWWVLATLVGSALDGVIVGTLAWGLGAGLDPAQALSQPTVAFWAAIGLSALLALGGPFKGVLTGWVLMRQV